MLLKALRALHSATQAALQSCSSVDPCREQWERAAARIEMAQECCSAGATYENFLMAQRHLREAVTHMYAGAESERSLEPTDAFAIARSSATVALYEIAARVAASSPRAAQRE